MKRIVILCDGTWNSTDSTTPTNVVRLGQAMESTGTEGMAQVSIYVRGVGSGEGVTRFGRKLDALLGGGFGWGLLRNIIEAYRHLTFLYEPGDEIFIFGFSRGAYTARSLTGFIRSTGIIDRDALHKIPEAIKRYRSMDEDTHPSSPESHAFRAALSPRVVTSQKEAEYRQQEGYPEAHLLRVAYLGVWDSVGALGVPKHIPLIGRWTARQYRFHDTDLSSMVRAARHGVALDERRPSFTPTRWGNLTELNAEHGEAGRTPYREAFFSGDHGSVGGGGDIRHLSSIALLWIIEGAQEAKLSFDAERLQAIAAEMDPTGPLRNTSKPPTGFINWLTRLRPQDRKGPSRLDQLHEATITRWSMEAKSPGFEPYRPGSLACVHEQLVAHYRDTVEGTEQETSWA